MNQIDKQYQHLLDEIIRFGVEKKDRTGTGTKSIFGYQVKHRMSDGFPLLTTKKMAWKQIVIELLWFLRGDTNIKYLVDNDCHIWDGDVYKNYCKKINEDLATWDVSPPPSASPEYKHVFIEKIKTDNEFAKYWGELGPIYGKQWRSWKSQYGDEYNNGHHLPTQKIQIDQIQNLINELKTNPDSRRLMVNAWNVGELDQMVLPPCHYGFQVYTRELSEDERAKLYNKNYQFLDKEGLDQLSAMVKTDNITPKRAISLMWNQRSVDTFLGLPFNIASYGLLLEIIAKIVNMVPEDLIGNLGDTHLYLNHVEQAQEQIKRIPYNLPTLEFDGMFNEIINKYNGNYTSKLTGNTPDYGYYRNLDNVIKSFSQSNFILENYQSHSIIKAPLNN